jgi:5-methylcytosine-specific restriction endonuclease McrA
MKVCPKCKVSRPLDRYYPSGGMCKDCRNAYYREYRSKNREEWNAYQREYHRRYDKENPEKRRSWQRRSNRKRWKSGKSRKSLLAWLEKHPTYMKRFSVRRRSLLRGATGNVSAEDLRIITEECQWKCTYCKIPLTPKTATYDHVIPIARGGLHVKENLTLACHSCNSSKKDRTPEEWRMIMNVEEDIVQES